LLPQLFILEFFKKAGVVASCLSVMLATVDVVIYSDVIISVGITPFLTMAFSN
jgi:hypothetical protein